MKSFNLLPTSKDERQQQSALCKIVSWGNVGVYSTKRRMHVERKTSTIAEIMEEMSSFSHQTFIVVIINCNARAVMENWEKVDGNLQKNTWKRLIKSVWEIQREMSGNEWVRRGREINSLFAPFHARNDSCIMSFFLCSTNFLHYSLLNSTKPLCRLHRSNRKQKWRLPWKWMKQWSQLMGYEKQAVGNLENLCRSWKFILLWWVRLSWKYIYV